MRYVRIWADLYSTGLIDENGASIPFSATTIEPTTWDDLQKWVEDYSPVIPMNEQRRAEIADLIEHLDARGLDLFRRIASAWTADIETGEPIHLLYWSEGRSRYVDP
jgi:hypothetical protein